MGLVGRRMQAAIAAAAAAVISAGLVTADLTAAPTPADAATIDPRPAAVAPRLVQSATTTTTSTTGGATGIDSTLTGTIRLRLSRATAAGYAVVVDVAGRGRVVSVHPDWQIRPASTQKLFTTLPLLLAGPERQLVTEIRASGPQVNGVLYGNLVVKSSGDPSLLLSHLGSLARQVRAHGIRKVTGELRLDIGSLPLSTRRSGWQPDSVPYDVGPLSPFPVREDTLSGSTAYLRNPTAANLGVLRRQLTNVGIAVRGGDRIVRASAATRVVATHASAPMAQLVRHTLVVSDNFFAESLLSIEQRWRVQQVISDANISGSYATDGSGLSYSDYETARGEVKLLEYAAASPAADALVASLPVACRSGTLADRFCGTIGEAMVWAKTGTLRHSRALSGYTYDGLGRRVTFSILTYGVSDLGAAANAIDRAVIAMRAYRG